MTRFTCCGPLQVIECEALLIATGRKPNVQGVGLENAGVEFDERSGVKVNDQLQTTNKVRLVIFIWNSSIDACVLLICYTRFRGFTSQSKLY